MTEVNGHVTPLCMQGHREGGGGDKLPQAPTLVEPQLESESLKLSRFFKNIVYGLWLLIKYACFRHTIYPRFVAIKYACFRHTILPRFVAIKYACFQHTL